MFFLRFPFSSRVPKRRYILRGKIIERKKGSNQYKVSYRTQDGNTEKCWVDVSNITSLTKEKETRRKKKECWNSLTKKKYYIVKTQDDKMKELDIFQNDTIKVVENPNDRGNCQFASVAHQLSQFGVYRSAQQLRMDAINHIQNWRSYYGEFLTEPLDTYAEKMKCSWEFGDHITLIALAREYNVQFLVVSSAGLAHTVIVSNNNRIENNRQTLTLGHFPEHHYVSITIEKEILTQIVGEISDAQEFENDSPEVEVENGSPDVEVENGSSEVEVENGSPEVLVDENSSDDSGKTGRSRAVEENRQSTKENFHVETLQRDVNSNAWSETGDGPIEEGELYIVSSNTDVDSKAESETSDGQITDGESHQRSLNVDVDRKDGEANENEDITEENSQEVHIYENGCLPPEIWTLVLQYITNQDPSTRFTLMRVSRLFCSIINVIPLPEIYISPNIIQNVPRQISVRRMIGIAGRNSGLVLHIRNIIRNPRWANAWLHLRERDHRWFSITYIWWRNWRV